MRKATTTCRMNEVGRLTIDEATREKLGIDDGEKHVVEVEVRVDAGEE